MKNCSYFREKIESQEELNDIINLINNELDEVNQKRQKINNDVGKNNEKVLKYLKSLQYIFKIPHFNSIEVVSIKSFGSTLSCNSLEKNTIRNNLIRISNKNKVPKFERLLLRISVANVFHFSKLII